MSDEPSHPSHPSAARPSTFWVDLRGAIGGRHYDYTSGRLGRAILFLAIPMVLEMAMQSVFAVADIFFVGRLGGWAVAAVGMTDSLLTVIFAVSMGLSMATTAIVARRIGEKKPEEAARSTIQALFLGAAFSMMAGLTGVLLAPDLLELMGATRPIVEQGSGFTAIILGGCVTVVMLFLINAAFRGAGDALMAMQSLWLANVVNIVLDPILIFGWGFIPEMGLEGAAWATIIGRGVGVFYQLHSLRSGKRNLFVSARQLGLDFEVMRRLLRISLIGMIQFLIGTASWLGIMRILALFGATALAGYTIAVRIIIFALLPSWGMGNAAATLVGQNLGAGKPHRAERSVWVTGFSNMAFLGVVALVFLTSAEPIIRLFTSEPEVVLMGVECLQIVSYSYVFMAFGMVTVQAFNGAGDTTTPTWINFFCYWFLQIPLAYILALPLGQGPRGVFIAIAIAQASLAVVSVVVFRRGYWKKRKI